jgi:hypothetical protein
VGAVNYVERICDLQADDRGLSDLLSMALEADEDIERLRTLVTGWPAHRRQAAVAREVHDRGPAACWSLTPR